MTVTEPGPPSGLPEGMDCDGEITFDGLGTAAWITDVGHVRGRNEDRLLVKPLWDGEYILLLVADGAGGHDAGDKAAEQVVESFNLGFPAEGPSPAEGDPGKWLREVVMGAHEQVKALGHGQTRPPASTVVGMIVERASLCGWRFHVGDSRLYVRGGEGMVAQWTRDHNITNGLIDRGLPVTQALKIADGGRLTQVLGGGSEPDPEILGPLALSAGQVFLICSDGVYGHNGDREVLLPAMNPELGTVHQRIKELKVAVLDGDAPDNLTAVLWQVPTEAVATKARETVTNSMRSVTASDIARHLAEQDEPAPEAAKPAAAPSSDGGSGMVLIIGMVVVLAVLYGLSRDKAPEDPEETPTEAPEPTPAPVVTGPLPWPDNPETADRLQSLVGGFAADWWDHLDPADKVTFVELLGELVAADSGPDVILSYVETVGNAPVEAEFVGWKQPGEEGRERATRAWGARRLIVLNHPVLGAQPGIPGLLADAACAQVRLGWPRVGTEDGGDVEQLGKWIDACLPADLGARSVKVRLGDWPTRGWTMDDLNLARYLALKDDGGAQLRDTASVENQRLLELGLLAGALSSPELHRVEVELKVVLSAADLPDVSTPEEAELLARGRGAELATLLRSAAGDGAAVSGSGWVAEDLAVSTDSASLDDEQRAALADLNRRVEVVLRAGVVEPLEEELPGEVEQIEEAELPDEPTAEPESPAEETPVEEAPVEETPVEETPAEETPAEETPAADETPADEPPAEEPPAGEETPEPTPAVEPTPEPEPAPAESTPAPAVEDTADQAK